MTPEVVQHMQQTLPHVKSIALFGIEAHVCVLQTALDLVESGYEVHIVADGMASCRAYVELKRSGDKFSRCR
jgi:nicotinamidase-related amidase